MTRRRRLAPPLCAALSIFVLAVACSHSSGGGSSAGDDGGGLDVTVCADEDCTDAAEEDGFAVDTGWVCPVVPVSSAGAGCDACVQASCDAKWCACAQDKTVNEAGTPGCLAELACLEACASGGEGGDGGDGAVSTCSDSGCSSGYGATESQDAQALVACMAQSCATACPAGTTLQF